jgi:hypothetical protein
MHSAFLATFLNKRTSSRNDPEWITGAQPAADRALIEAGEKKKSEGGVRLLPGTVLTCEYQGVEYRLTVTGFAELGSSIAARSWDAEPTPLQLTLAHSHRRLAMLDSGVVKSLRELARRDGVHSSFVSRNGQPHDARAGYRWRPSSTRPFLPT